MVMLPDANFFSFYAVSLLPEHKIGIFVRFLALDPPFSGISSTKSAFLCSDTGGAGRVK